jgi:16S rRNA (cytidine1402-2'-O)-methyltransferase
VAIPPVEAGCLTLVATPIGHLGDVSARLREVLAGAGAIACEDTRRTLKLLSALQIPRPRHYFSCHDHNEARAAGRIVGLLRDGIDVALVSDAGTPLVSDPGYDVVRAVIEADLPMTSVPGPSAALSALSLSGLPPSSFTVLGFMPRRPGRVRRELARERRSPHTLILFESPHRIGRLLIALQEVLGDRQAAVCVDLTKRFEKVLRGPLSALQEQVSILDKRGEITVVVAGAPRRGGDEDEIDEDEIDEELDGDDVVELDLPDEGGAEPGATPPG